MNNKQLKRSQSECIQPRCATFTSKGTLRVGSTYGGFKYVKNKIDSRKCNHKLSNIMVQYEQVKIVAPRTTGVDTNKECFSCFMDQLKKFLKKYIKHHSTFAWSFQEITTFQASLSLRNILSNDWDFINNPAVKYYIKTQQMWGKQTKYSYMVNVEKWCNDMIQNAQTKLYEPDINEESSHFFIKQKKHGFSTALYVVKTHFQWRIKYWQQEHNCVLKTVFNCSDRGEFLCTAFMDGVSVISFDLGVNIFWYTGESEHGKRKVDGEGHVGKTTKDRAIRSKQLRFTKKQEHVITAKEFCDEYFNKPHHKLKRNFFAITDEIKQNLTDDVMEESMKGIMSMYNCICLLFFVRNMKCGQENYHVFVNTVSLENWTNVRITKYVVHGSKCI
eukprot:51278_1